MELGVYSFAEVAPCEHPARRIEELVEEIELADRVGLDVFGVGEHHRPDFAVSAPAVVLAAAAARTERIRLTSAVSVVSSDDPIRLFQQFSLLDLLSGGRAEIMAGRGSFIESFRLFGFDLRDYDRLFAEKLETLLELRDPERATSRGVYPLPLQQPLPLWIGVGGTPQSAVRAGSLGLPMALGIIGGEPARFQGFVDLFREAARRAGKEPPPLGINSHGFLADTRSEALELSYGPVSRVMNRIGRERGWPLLQRHDYEASATLRGANFVGSPHDVTEKVLHQHQLFGHDRFLLQLTVGPMPHDAVLHAIELFGREVAPAVRSAIPT